MSGATAREFVRATLEAFDAARLDANEAPERAYRIAGEPVVVRYAGARLADRFDAALAPFAEESGASPALTISCWDRSTVDRPPPPPPWTNEDLLPRNRVRGYDADGIRATYDASQGLLQLYDPDRSQAICFAQDAGRVAHWVSGAPFRTLFGWWATHRGHAVIHASAVGSQAGCVLVSGPSGSGKSTTALACVARGLGIISDDVVLVALGTQPVAFASTAIAKIDADSPIRVEELGRTAVERNGGQTTLDVSDRLVGHAPVRALIAVHVGTERRCRVEPMSPGAGFRALAGHSVVGLSGDQRSLPLLRDLARRAPAFSLELGSDLDDVAATVRAVLDGTS